ncbi:MAG: ATP-binding protein [Selenomonadaceae bacterium]|nr:ATP-binding protein [Selenomonadaceae bacterium]
MEWKIFPATKENYYSMLDYVLNAAEESGVSAKQQISLELGFEEVATNIIDYAYGENVGEISIRAYLDADHFFIELKDSGVPFNPLTMSEAEKPTDLESAKEGGLGISFMRRIFDEMSYHFGQDGEFFCNRLKLGMKLSEEPKGFL